MRAIRAVEGAEAALWMLAAVDPIDKAVPLFLRRMRMQHGEHIKCRQNERGEHHPVGIVCSVVRWEKRFEASQPVFDMALFVEWSRRDCLSSMIDSEGHAERDKVAVIKCRVPHL